jgi:hypothetical protein
MASYSSKKRNFCPGKAHLENKLTYRPTRRPQRVEPLLHLTQAQVAALRAITGTYLPDLHDPAAVEVLLVLLEVCHVLALSEWRLAQIFGSHLHALESWGDIVPPRRRPTRLRRAWVWVPNTLAPKLYSIEEQGIIRLYPDKPGELKDEEDNEHHE